MMTDNVNHPQHYTRGKIETIEVIDQITSGYPENLVNAIGRTVKYLDRAPFKNNTLEDLKKARWYLNCAIDKLEGTE